MRASHRKHLPVRTDWVSKTLAGLLLGLALGLCMSGVLSQLLRSTPLPVRGQLVMWSVAPVWLATWSGVYFFASGLRAWAWLGSATAITYGCWQVLRSWVA